MYMYVYCIVYVYLPFVLNNKYVSLDVRSFTYMLHANKYIGFVSCIRMDYTNILHMCSVEIRNNLLLYWAYLSY